LSFPQAKRLGILLKTKKDYGQAGMTNYGEMSLICRFPIEVSLIRYGKLHQYQ